jgi:copper chaperone CopZ
MKKQNGKRAASKKKLGRRTKNVNQKERKMEKEGKVDIVVQKKKSYYLICSTQFLTQYLYFLTFNIFILQVIITNRYLKEQSTIIYDYIIYQAMSFSHQLGAWVVISLLSSSCCAFQLILNCFSIGCAGLNSALGPLRPFFVSVVTITQAWQFISIEKQEQYLRAYISLAVTCALTFLPEILYLHVQYKDNYCYKRPVNGLGIVAKNGGYPDKKNEEEISNYKLKIDGMNCIACVQTIKNTIESTEGVIGRSTVVLETGEAFVQMNAWQQTVPLLATKINNIGFKTDVKNIEKISSPLPVLGKVTAATPIRNTTSVSDFTIGILAGLLSSSCCILQLGLNVLSVFELIHIGCAGFNIILGPLRPYLRLLTLSWLCVLWFHALKPTSAYNSPTQEETRHGIQKSAVSDVTVGKAKSKNSKHYFTKLNVKLFINTIITLTLMFMPEGLKYFGGPSIAPPTTNAVKKTFVVDNMGCEACIDAVGRIINRANGVVSSNIELDTGEATVWIAKDWNFDPKDLDKHLKHHGYELHEEGHITKKMLLDKSLGVKKDRTGSSWL